MIEYCMPSLGADMEAGTLREWRVKPGDYVRRGDIIADVETQKGIVEIEVFDEGKIEKLLIDTDSKIPVGTPMALILPPGETAAAAAADIEKPVAEASSEQPLHEIKVSPLARRIAAENNIDLKLLKGSGPDGAITKDDVEKAIRSNQPAEEKSPDFSGNIRQAIASAMSKSNREIPHYYLQTRIDMTRSLAWLREENKKRSVRERLLQTVLLIKAVAKSLKDVPELNAVWEDKLVMKNEINIGFVVSLREGGLIIPAIHNADKKSLSELMESLNDLIPRARNLKLKSSELSDSTITITSLGDNSADTVFGVIYPPQVALVGFGEVVEQPWAENGMLGIRQIINATLSGDHRATDGQTGSRFLRAIKNYLQRPEEL